MRHDVAEVGDVVRWWESGAAGEGTFAAGVVTRLGNGTSVTLSLVLPDMHNLPVKDGCKHAGDPTLREEERRTNGVWEHTPRTLAVMHLLAPATVVNNQPAPASPDPAPAKAANVGPPAPAKDQPKKAG